MRIPTLLVFLLSISTIIKSQVPTNAVSLEDSAFNTLFASRSIPSVSGKLENMSADELKNLPITYTLVIPFSEFQKTKIVFAQPDGSFKLELDYAFPYQQIWFAVGDFIFKGLYANKDLFLKLDMKKIKAAKETTFDGDGINYLGTDGPLNVYMNNYVFYRKSEQQQLSASIDNLVHYSSRDADSILSDLNKLFDSVKKIEDDYIITNPSPYSWILENERMSYYFGKLCIKYVGKIMNDSLWLKIKQHKSYLVSNSGSLFYNYLCTYIRFMPNPKVTTSWKDVKLLTDLNSVEKAMIDSLEESQKKLPAYSCTPEKIQQWSKQLQPRIQSIIMLQSLNKNIARIDSLFSPAKADFLKLQLNTSTDLNEQKMELEHILQGITTDWCSTVLKNEYKLTTSKINEINKTLANTKKGSMRNIFGKPLLQTSFGASMYDASGIKTLDLLTRLVQTFSGKAIIIDRWATWCGPCINEMPHSKKLQEESKDLPVVFVYLCTVRGSTESKWKSKVAELKQPGIHILIDETQDADLSNYFSFSGYPGYAFFNKAGTYLPGVIKWMSNIENREALAELIKR